MFYVVYGSQTGNSEAIAKRISMELKTIQNINNEYLVLNKFLSTMQKFPEKKNEKNFVILVCSTTGNGDAPNNGDNFVRWIKRKTHSSDLLSNVYYTILGLGDSNYSKYQYIPRQIDEYLTKLGAGKFNARGEADEAYGLERVVEPWINNLYVTLTNFLQTLTLNNCDIIAVGNNEVKFEKIENSTAELINLKYKWDEIKNENKENINQSNSETIKKSNKLKFSSSDSASYDLNNIGDHTIQKQTYFNANLISKNILSGEKSQKKIISIIFNTNERKLRQYTPGSYISILPETKQEILEVVYSVIDLSEKYIQIDKYNNFEIYSNILEKYPHFNKIIEKRFISHKDIFEFFVDFTGVLKKSQMDHLKILFNNKLQNESLKKSYDILFQKYSELILKNKISLFDFLQNLHLENEKINMNLNEIFEFFPMKYSRHYSLVSNSICDSDNLEIIFTLVKDRIIRKFPDNLKLKSFANGEYYFLGQCTNFLDSLEIDSKVIITEIKNNFVFPMNKFIEESIPIVYVCNGTGITPCISFLKELKVISEKNDYYSLNKIANLTIFTGFRNANEDKKETIYEDFIFKTIETINKKLSSEVITYKRCLSSSEENEEEAVGMWRNCRINSSYVQDLILDNQEIIIDLLINKNGYLMICGDLEKLYDELLSNIVLIMQRIKYYPKEYCIKIIEDMKHSNKIILEKWL